MNDKIREALIKLNEEDADWFDPDDPWKVLETLRELPVIDEGEYDRHRHWNRHRHWTCWYPTVAINTSLHVTYEDATSDGDMSARDKGWEFELDSIDEVPIPVVMDQPYLEKARKGMQLEGGGFMKALAAAMELADLENLRKIANAWEADIQKFHDVWQAHEMKEAHKLLNEDSPIYKGAFP